MENLSQCSLDELLTKTQLLNQQLNKDEISLEEYIPLKNSLDNVLAALVNKNSRNN